MMPPEPWGEHEAAGIYRGTRWCGGAAACGARAVGDRIVSRRIHGHDVGGGLSRGHGPVGRFVRRSGADRERHDHRAGATGSRPRVQAGDFEGLPRLVIGLFFLLVDGFRDGTHAIDKELRGRTERSVLQRNNRYLVLGVGKGHRQDFE